MARPTKTPRIPREREVLWQALRKLRIATTAQLIAISERPKKSVQRDLRYFEATGYIRSNDAKAVYRDRSWRLLRDTGPKPPLFMMEGKRAIGAIDRNTRQAFGIGGGEPPPPKRIAPWMAKLQLGRAKAR